MIRSRAGLITPGLTDWEAECSVSIPPLQPCTGMLRARRCLAVEHTAYDICWTLDVPGHFSTVATIEPDRW